MRRFAPIAAFALVAACGSGGPPEAADDEAAAPAAAQPADAQPADAQPAAASAAAGAAPDAPAPRAAGWDLVSSGEGSALVLGPAAAPAIRLFCPARAGRLLVKVPGFRPIGSEERLSFGSGGTVVALVADTRGDRLRGGVSGTGAVPADLPALVAGPVSASYGAQTSGPHAPPPADLARGFVAACRDSKAGPTAPPARTPSGPVSACLMQEGERISVAPLKAVGTEPFWAARVEGRCVTYSHPEDQDGTRVWTRYAPGAGGGGTWSGALRGSRFVMEVRPRPGCSDGMSDKRYPFEVDLLVGGERRRGCAEPA